MAKFTFGNADTNNGVDGQAGTDAGGKSGSDNGAASPEGSNNGATANNTGDEGQSPDEFPRKRRGRKPYPRDAAGKPIKPDAPSGAGSTADKSGKDRLGVKNDRAKVRANIEGLHAIAAVLTKTPILALNDKEADALSNSLCDVADYHGMNLLTAGGAFGLYASLATTAYMIYVPRIIMIKHEKAANNARPINPATPNEAREDAASKGAKMDFSGDTMQ